MRRLLPGRRQLERLAELESKVVKFGRAQREHLAAQEARLARLGKTVAARASASSVQAMARRVEELQASLSHLDRTMAEGLERVRVADELGHEDRRLARRVESMLRSRRPIVVGPWTGEVGFELLYWIPFVRWVVQAYRVPPERLIVVSRGGVRDWYAGLASTYEDVLAYYTPDEFRAATEASKKQRRERSFDAAVVERIQAARGLGRVSLLHPGMMYRLLMPFWKELAPISRADRYAVHARIEAATDPVSQQLPAEYVAARFYFSECFPDTPANRALVGATLESLARTQTVVLLNTPYAVDDHYDAALGGAHVMTLPPETLPPASNLAVQTAVIAGARQFVGTYGGYSYLAPLCGVSSLAFYSQRSFQTAHLDVAQRAFAHLGGARVIPIDANDVSLLRHALGGVHATT